MILKLRFLLLASLLGCSPAFATIAIGASTLAQAVATSVTTTGITTSASGSAFVVYVAQHGGTPYAVTLTDNKGNSANYSHIAQVGDGNQNYVDIFYVANGAGGTGMTWTATVSTVTYLEIVPVELTGAATSSVHDASSPAAVTGSFTAPVSSNSFSASPPSGGEMLLSIFTTASYVNPITFTAPTGFTILQSQTNGTGNYPALAVAYEEISSAGTAQAVNWNEGSTTSNVIITLDGFLGTSGGASCTNDGYEPAGGVLAVPNGTSGSFLSCSGTLVTPNCSSITYYQQSGGKCAVN